MKKKVLAIAIASAMVVPSAFAAEDTSGMHFVSASEGFYASVRARYESGDLSHEGADIENASSRFGVRGTNDLGGGLEGFYQYEAAFSIDNGGDGATTRLGTVGLRGAFGQLQLGSFWAADYNWTHGSTDIANTASGFFNYTAERPGRTSKGIEYTSPDLNGFQAAVRVNLNTDSTGARAAQANSVEDVSTNVPNNAAPETPSNAVTAKDAESDKNDVDSWNLSAIYNIQGFTVAGAYGVVVDGLGSDARKALLTGARNANSGVTGVTRVFEAADANTQDEDLNSWTARVGYAQDNWYVNAWYGEDSTSDLKGYAVTVDGGPNPGTTIAVLPDLEIFSIGGGVTVDKVALYALYETAQLGSVEDNRGTVGVQYNIGSQSRVWVEYAARDLDTNPEGEDSVNIGMRHDF